MIRKILIITSALILFLLFASGAYIYTLLDQTTQASESESELQSDSNPDSNGTGEQIPESEIDKIDSSSIYNILILGLDSLSDKENARADTIMIATVDNKNKTLKLTSILRDTYVTIPGKPANKINASFALGSEELTLQTINENFGLDIARYVILDFKTFEEVIDIVGGVSVELSAAEAESLNRNLNLRARMDNSNLREYHVNESGVQTLNGKQALAFARIRDVGRNDFRRVERQQIIMSSLLNEIRNLSPLRYPSLVASVLTHAETNIPSAEILNLAATALMFPDRNIHRFRVPVDGTYESRSVRGVGSVLVADMNENRKLFHYFLLNPPESE